MKTLSFIFNFMAVALMIASVWHNELQFIAIMAGIFAIYYKIDA